MSIAPNTAPEPSTPKGQATRARLLATARKLAISSGGHFEIAEVADAAGVVPSLVHRYFGSKAGLVGALVDDFFQRFHAEVFELDLEDRGTWAEHERLRLEAGVRFHYREPFAAIVYGSLSRDPEIAAREEQGVAAVVDRAARSIRRGQRAGELPVHVDAGLAGAAMFGAMRQVMVYALTHTPRPRVDRVIEVLWRQVAASVEIDPEQSIAKRS